MPGEPEAPPAGPSDVETIELHCSPFSNIVNPPTRLRTPFPPPDGRDRGGRPPVDVVGREATCLAVQLPTALFGVRWVDLPAGTLPPLVLTVSR